MSAFGTLLRQHRTAAGLSQESLAERARMSVEGISALERGYRRNPQRQTVAALADALGLVNGSRREFEAGALRAAEPPVELPDEARLPIALSAFIGRADEIAEIGALLHENRLVTIVGSGGAGKTQIALRVAGGLRSSGIFGARFVGLASLDASGSVVAAIAAALGVQEQTGRSLDHALLAHLRNKNLVLLLDNCEHVVESAATSAAALLAGCPRLRILATSREPLKIDGERTYRLASLRGDDAVALFADRACAADHHFAIGAETEPIVRDICARLDNLPLAIELAAARVRLLPLQTLAAKLDDRFRILAGTSRTALPRQQTLRATIDWSYDLLAPAERQLYECLSVFNAGCTLEGAVAVVPADAPWRDEMLDVLSSLVDKSLLTVDSAGTQPRYRFLESFRQHARDKLSAGGDAQAVARRQAGAVLSVAQQLRRTVEWDPADVEPELENARSAIEWAIAAGDVSLAARVACAFTPIWRTMRGDAQPCRWLEELQPLLSERNEPEIAAQAWRALASLRQGTQKIEAARRATALTAATDDRGNHIAGLTLLTSGLMEAGRLDEAQAAGATALQLCRVSGLLESQVCAAASEVQAHLAVRRGDYVDANRWYREALTLMVRYGSAVGATTLRHNVAELELLLGNAERALDLAAEAADAARRMRFGRFEAIALTNVAACSLALGDIEGARRFARDALELAQGAYPWATIVAIQHLATVAALGGNPECGARLRGYVDAWYRAKGCEPDAAEARAYETLIGSLRQQLSEADIARYALDGAALTEERATLEALEVAAA